jgi:hypothetical protein
MRVHSGMEVKGPKEKPKKQYMLFDDNSEEWDYALDREVMIALLKNYAENVPTENQPSFYKDIRNKFCGNVEQYVDNMLKKSVLYKPGKRIYFNKKSFMKDPGVKYGLSLVEFLADIQERIGNVTDSISEQEKYLCAAKLRMEEDLPHYSDANFTMRLSYGQVKEYRLGNWHSGYRTTAPSMVAKMKKGDSIEDYKVQPEMIDLMRQAGDMPLCFLTTNDITGGNSGSPIFDGKNRLIGLAFDGNWDSLSSDIFFDAQLARCIGVDIRYVLYMMESWGKADRLLKEIGAK